MADPIDSEGERKPPFNVVEPIGKGRGGNRLIWVATVVVVGLILAYAAGLLR